MKEDLAEILMQLTNLIINERIQAYNEGVDAERDRCIKASAAVMNMDPASASGPLFDVLRNN